MPNQVAMGQRSSANDMSAVVGSEYPSGISHGVLFANMILGNYFQKMTIVPHPSEVSVFIHDICSVKDGVST